MRFLFLILLILHQKSYGQISLPYDSVTKRFCISKIITADSLSTKNLLQIAKNFTKTDKEKFFMSNGSRNMGTVVMFGMNKAKDDNDVNAAKSDIGFDSYDEESNSILAHCVWRREGNAMGCVRLMIIKGDIIIRCKDGKSKIEITNMHYNHYNISNGKAEPVYGSENGDCKSRGTLEALYQCDKCDGQLLKLSDFIYDETMSLIKQYKVAISQRNGLSNTQDW